MWKGFSSWPGILIREVVPSLSPSETAPILRPGGRMVRYRTYNEVWQQSPRQEGANRVFGGADGNGYRGSTPTHTAVEQTGLEKRVCARAIGPGWGGARGALL